ncbi:hypothetical protein OLX02_06650 [Novosphingobium sp. KCTC 2891]|uniref:hypothetical protein n=1 Tax=Novosphingobium sp. KCTC 2891 TaxID=2989730 RepID=UPI00222315AD|nr:hypothetical protein [Novosphingobium sp. KCTC 2891]MCW1382497.1 hypothetical protein [Novosphingobium sp. KCTC 2891]
MIRHLARAGITGIAAVCSLAALSGCTKSAASTPREGAPLDAVRLSMPQSEALPGAPVENARAGWTGNGDEARFGYAGETPLLTLACRSGVVLVTRHSPAEVGAQALFALQGSGHILRLPVDATSVPGQRGYLWQGSLNPDDPGAAVFQGAFNGTLPGGGMIKVVASDAARDVLRRCKASPAVAAPLSAAAPE